MNRGFISGAAIAALITTQASAAVLPINFLDATSGSHPGAFTVDSAGTPNDYPLSVLCGAITATPGAVVANCAEVNSSGQLAIAGPVTNAGTFAVQAAESGTWTVQPGNTANTTAWLFNLGSVGGTALTSAVSAYGTAPTGTAVEGVNAFITNTNPNVTPGDGITTTTYGTNAASPVIGSGLLFNGTTYDRMRSAGATGITAVGGAAASAAAVAGNPVLTGGSDGTNARSFLTSTTGHLVVDCGSAGGSCSGSGGTSSSFGSAFPSTGTASGLTDGTNMVGWRSGTFGTTPGAVTGTGSVNSSLFIGTVAAVAAASGVQKVGITGNAGGTLDTASGTAASTGLSVQGMSAAGATFSDAPMGNGLNAITTNPTAVTNGQKVKQMGDVQGKEVNMPYSPAALANNGQGSSTTTAAITVQAASGSASFKEYMTSLSCSRNDAGTTAITVAISDGTTTVTKALPNNGGGGTVTWPFPVPRAWAANTAVTVTPSSGVTTLNCDATGYNAT